MSLSPACDIRVVAPSERFAIPGAKDGVPVSPDLARGVAGPVGGSGVRTKLVAGMRVNLITAVGFASAAERGPFTPLPTMVTSLTVVFPLQPSTTASLRA